MQLNKNIKIDTCNNNIYVYLDCSKQVICLNKSAAQVIDWETKKINSVDDFISKFDLDNNCNKKDIIDDYYTCVSIFKELGLIIDD